MASTAIPDAKLIQVKSFCGFTIVDNAALQHTGLESLATNTEIVVPETQLNSNNINIDDTIRGDDYEDPYDDIVDSD